MKIRASLGSDYGTSRRVVRTDDVELTWGKEHCIQARRCEVGEESSYDGSGSLVHPPGTFKSAEYGEKILLTVGSAIRPSTPSWRSDVVDPR